MNICTLTPLNLTMPYAHVMASSLITVVPMLHFKKMHLCI
jgi:hypothetical protein